MFGSVRIRTQSLLAGRFCVTRSFADAYGSLAQACRDLELQSSLRTGVHRALGDLSASHGGPIKLGAMAFHQADRAIQTLQSCKGTRMAMHVHVAGCSFLDVRQSNIASAIRKG